MKVIRVFTDKSMKIVFTLTSDVACSSSSTALGDKLLVARRRYSPCPMLRARLERETGPKANGSERPSRLPTMRFIDWHLCGRSGGHGVRPHRRAGGGQSGDHRSRRRHPLVQDCGTVSIEKVTRDHSPVGEREDGDELSELEAMRHPRRNEVYRDVGSEAHDAADPDFVDLQEISFEADEALLLCSDGLTDLVPSASLNQIVPDVLRRSRQVVRVLIDAAKDAGGKDNITVVYVEGDNAAIIPRRGQDDRLPGPPLARRRDRPGARLTATRRGVRLAIVILIVVLIGACSRGAHSGWLPALPSLPRPQPSRRSGRPGQRVHRGGVGAGEPGSQIVVEPGEYREQLSLRDDVRIVSRLPRGATMRLPVAASEGEPAVVAEGLDRRTGGIQNCR